MDNNSFKIIEEDGLIIFDGSDDYVPGEKFIDDNDELDIEYLLRVTELNDEIKSAGKAKGTLVSCAIVLFVVLYVGLLCLMYY